MTRARPLGALHRFPERRSAVIRATIAAAAVAGLALLVPATTAHAAVRQPSNLTAKLPTHVWQPRTKAAIAAYEKLDDSTADAFILSYEALAVAGAYGWNDPRVHTYLQRVMSLRNPSGAWGLGY